MEENVALSRFDLRTRPVQTKNSGLYIGAEGMAQYTAVRRDRYWLVALNVLADFALFSGVGTQTTIGMGQARRRWPLTQPPHALVPRTNESSDGKSQG